MRTETDVSELFDMIAALFDPVLGQLEACSQRVEVIIPFAEALIQIGKVGEAIQLFGRIDDPRQRDEAYVKLVEALVGAEKLEQARQIMNQIDEACLKVNAAIAIAEKSSEVEDVEAIRRLLPSLSKAEELRSLAAIAGITNHPDDFGRAWQAADAINDARGSYTRDMGFFWIIRALARNGRFKQAIDTIQRINLAFVESQALVVIGKALAEQTAV